jgi:hypothetical protein
MISAFPKKKRPLSPVKKKDYNQLLGIEVEAIEIDDEVVIRESIVVSRLKKLQKIKQKQREIIEKCKKDPFISPVQVEKPEKVENLD